VDVRDRSSRLDARAERTARARTDRRSPARPRGLRLRRIGAVALVATLALAWLAIDRAGRASTAPAPTTVADVAPVDPTPLRAVFAGQPGCADHGSDVPEVACTIDGVRVDARLLGPAEAERAFAPIRAAQEGPPACAQGQADERNWSRPAAPEVAVGRYRCLVARGRAEMWWTDDAGIIAHAVGADADLARLFAWWRAHLS
jgi:hypothetical protein